MLPYLEIQQSGGGTLILDEVIADVSSQLDAQEELGIQITRRNEVPDTGPTNKGVWWQIPNVTAVYADLKGSTALSAESTPRVAAFAYTYFIRATALILERFGAGYVDIQGDGIFGLFSGSVSAFSAAASAITMRTQIERDVAKRFERDTQSEWELTAGIGIGRGTLLVRRLGLRGTKQNEVWAGKPVNMAAKLSSVADSNQVVVSERVFRDYEQASKLRRRVLIWSCGCNGSPSIGKGLDVPPGQTTCLWGKEPAPQEVDFDLEFIHRLKSAWCKIHGPEFCEALVTGKRPQI